MGFYRYTNNLSIGNGSIWNLANYIVNRTCSGGLLQRTIESGIRAANIFDNYSSGYGSRTGRYGYTGTSSEGGDIPSTNFYFYEGNGISKSRVIGDFLGDAYGVEEKSNSNLKFMTVDDFTDFQTYLRDNNLERIDSYSFNHDKYGAENFIAEDYLGNVTDYQEYGDIPLPMERGEEYSIPTKVSVPRVHKTLEEYGKTLRDILLDRQKYVKKSIGMEDEYLAYQGEGVGIDMADRVTAKGIIASNPMDGEDKRQFNKLKGLVDSAVERREFLSKMMLPTSNIISRYAVVDSKHPIDSEGLFENYSVPNGEVVDLSKIVRAENGLLEFTKSYREKYVSQLPGIKYPFDMVLKKMTVWTRENSYGVETNNRGEEYYSVNGTNNYSGSSISSAFKGGNNSVYNPSTGKRTYSYYQEPENGAAPLSVNTNITDNSAVHIGGYDNASRLLKKTNQLFKEAKVNTLINRFHTVAVDGDDELVTAYDKNFGMSRGRNLLKKEYEGKTAGDATSGYDNPYCRVWTAHHQYATLKDRIRPFYSDNGAIDIEKTQEKYGELRPYKGNTRLSRNSVLQSNGFVRITPTNNNGKVDEIKNYMFSIENLAWRDIVELSGNNDALSPEQIGPNRGRIMWFPPYNLKFTENVNVGWNSNQFIGRGENIYTYTNTERSGTLSFTILIDHPSIINKWRGTSEMVVDKEAREKDLLRFFAGCDNLSEDVVAGGAVTVDKHKIQTETIDPQPTQKSKDIAYVIFFSNDFSSKDYLNDLSKSYVIEENGEQKVITALEMAIRELQKYETSHDGSYSGRDDSFKDEYIGENNIENLNQYGLNSGECNCEEKIKQTLFGSVDENLEIRYFDGANGLWNIDEQITGDKIFGLPSDSCSISSIDVKGFASSHGTEVNNKKLCDRRRNVIETILKHKCPELANVTFNELDGKIITVNDIDGNKNVNTFDAKLARAAYAIIHVVWNEENTPTADPSADSSIYTVNYCDARTMFMGNEAGESEGYSRQAARALAYAKQLANSGTASDTREVTVTSTDYTGQYTYDNEYLYFSKIADEGKLVYQNIIDKIRYFDPAYHSITPEGFNARLTFLHQCTRQGPTNAVSNGNVTSGSTDYLKYAGNLSFGRAPYCILRIGDFYNTKICIDSMSIDYDNGGGLQWDMNQEGIGVQPMMANVNLNFKFIGGQDIEKPIERLQNAVTANYYANASIYSRHADNSEGYYDAIGTKVKNRSTGKYETKYWIEKEQ